MTARQTEKGPIPLWIPLLLAGFYLAARSRILLAAARWRPEEIGPFLIAASAAALCGFFPVAEFRRKFVPYAGFCGAVLLTLSAGMPTHTLLPWLPDLLFAGGCAAFFVRTRKKNTFFPFAAGFAAGLAAVSWQAPRLGSPVCALSAMLLTGVLIVNAVRLKHARWLLLTMILMQVMIFANDFPVGRGEERRRLREEQRLAAVSALPSSLIPDAVPGKLAVLQVTRRMEDAAAAPWKQLPYVSHLTVLPVEHPVPVGKRLGARGPSYDLISLEVLPRWPECAFEPLVKRLFSLAAKDGGCVIVPRSVLRFLPPGQRPVPVPVPPGSEVSENGRFAAGRIPDSGVSPEALDYRLQRHLAAAGDRNFMPPGAFTALFMKENGRTNAAFPPVPEPQLPRRHAVWFWSILGILCLTAHLLAARTRAGSSFIAGVDNAASTALIVLAAFLPVAENRMYSILPETALLWCVPLCIPFCGRKGKLELFLLVCSLVLPWCLAGPWHDQSGIILAAALVTAFSCGITGAKLLLEPGASRDRLAAAFFCGTALAGALAHFFLSPESLLPVLAAATVLRLGCLVRL